MSKIALRFVNTELCLAFPCLGKLAQISELSLEVFLFLKVLVM